MNDISRLRPETLAARKRAERTTKRCARCKKWKSRSLFGKSRSEFDGFNCYCKLCIVWRARAYRKSDKGAEALRASHRKYRLKNREKIRESNRKYRLENAEVIRAYFRKLRLKNPEKISSYHRKYRRDNPEKCRAHSKINRLIQRGKIIRGDCEVCGKKNAEAHHGNYAKPLSVRWLCRKHHVELHANYGEAE